MNIKSFRPLAGYSFDSIHLMVNIFGIYELDEIKALNRLFNKLSLKNGIALDVGANIGNHTVGLFSKYFKRVLCFEPNPSVFSLLTLNTSHLDNVECLNYGLGSSVCQLPFRVNTTNLGASRIIQESSNSEKFDEIIIDIFPLDDFQFSDPIELIKLDVEGHELSFLRGAQKTILSHNPIILFEENFENTDSSGNSLVIKQMKDWNYKFFVFQSNFHFGNNKFSRLLGYLFQDVFGAKYKLVERNLFNRSSYNMIVAIPQNISLPKKNNLI